MTNKISTFLQSKINEGDFPSAVYLVAEKGEIKLQDAIGFAVLEPKKIEATNDTIYDLASLTKVLVTGLLCAKLIQRKEINLSDKVAKFLSDFDSDEKREITIENLLTHASGCKAWFPFYLISGFQSQLSKIIVSKSLGYPIKEKIVYSDINFLTLGLLVEKVYGKSLYEITKKEIIEPLSLQHTYFNPPNSLLEQIAASEKGNAFEKQMCIDLGYKIQNHKSKFRPQTIWGEVHDNNCYFMDGVAGHAGLFSNTYDTFKIAQQFLAGSTEILKPETCRLFRKNLTPEMNQSRSLAFQLAETVDSTASEALSKDSFGHLGFTGTSLWIDPTKERIYILLTNRTHNRNLPFADMKTTRQRFHRLATIILDKDA